MSRELKFRGKRRDTGEWVYGYSYEARGIAWIIAYDSEPIWYEVNPATVGQYTGLKDKRGVEIFEGDIIAPGDGTVHRFPGEVIWNTEEARWSISSVDNVSDLSDFWAGHALELEVIGNVHDNPKLLV